MDDLKIIVQAALDRTQSDKKINAQLKQIKTDPIIISAKFNDTELRRALKDINAAKLSPNVETLSRNIEKAQQRILNLKTQYSSFVGDKKLLASWQSLFNESQIVKTQAELRRLNSGIGLFEQQLTAAGKRSKSVFGQIGENVKAFASWYLIGNAIASLSRNATQAVETLKEVDTYLTEISKTSDRTAASLKQLGYDAFDYANKYGATVQGYLSGIQEFSRAGKENADQLAELSILAQSAGDMNADLANDYLLATDAAFKYKGNVELLNAALDGQNQVTNRNAVSMEELANATKVSASIASQAGVEIDQMTALLGTGIATTRESGETVGRAIRSILMNLQQVSGEVDGEVLDEESFEKVEKRLHSVGVATEEVVDGVAKLRDPIQILKELAEVYNSLPENSADKAGIISDLGGKYRGNVLSSILSNWDMYEKMLSDYQDSTGSALREAEKTANSWEGRLNRLSNTWTAFVQNFADSDSIENGITMVENFIKVLDTLTNTLGAIPTLAAAAAGALSGIKNVGQSKMFDCVNMPTVI